MKNQLLKVSFKFGFILGGINLIFKLINTFIYTPDNLIQWNNVLNSSLWWVLQIVFIAMAHYEYNKKNENYISFKDAILIGLIAIGISFFVSTVYSYFSYECNLEEKMQLLYSNMNEKNGIEISEHLISTGKFILLAAAYLPLEIVLLFLIITVESLWIIYKKAGKEGWASIVPIYNIIVLLEIVKKPTWYFLLLIIPFVNIIIVIWMTNQLSQRFGKGEGFTIGLIFLPFIFYPLLGMSKAEYIDE